MIGRNTVFAFPGSHQYVRIPETNDPKQLPTVIGQIANMTKSASFMFGCRADLSAAGWTQYSGPWPPPQPAAPAAAPRPPAAGTSPGITVHRLAPSGYYLVAGQEAWQFTPEQVSAATAPSSGVPTSFTIGGSTFYLAFSGNDAAVQVNGARVTAMGFGTIAGDVASAPRSDVLPRVGPPGLDAVPVRGCGDPESTTNDGRPAGRAMRRFGADNGPTHRGGRAAAAGERAADDQGGPRRRNARDRDIHDRFRRRSMGFSEVRRRCTIRNQMARWPASP